MSAADENPLPAPLDQLWGRRGGPGRAERKAGLSAERIIGAAIEIADETDLHAVTMSRVAERLGFTTMSLYRHVASKDELLLLMVDQAVAMAPGADAAPPGAWRSGLERWGWDLLAVLRDHRWLLEIPLSRPAMGPGRFAWLDRGLMALAETELTEHEKAAVILLLNNYVFSEAQTSAEIEARGGSAGAVATYGGSQLAKLIDQDDFPALHRAVEAGIFESATVEQDAAFAFGLTVVLDGIESLVARGGAEA